MVSGMLSSGRLREFRPTRESAMDRFVERIQVEAKENGGAVWVLKNARFAVFCILLTMCFGVHLDEESIFKIDQVIYTGCNFTYKYRFPLLLYYLNQGSK